MITIKMWYPDDDKIYTVSAFYHTVVYERLTKTDWEELLDRLQNKHSYIAGRRVYFDYE